jgi:hypothetical protein
VNRLFVPAKRILFGCLAFVALACGSAFAEADNSSVLAVSRLAGGASGGVVEVRVNGALWGMLYSEDRVERELVPGTYRVAVRLLSREGGSEVYGVAPLEQQVSVAAGSLREIKLSLVPEMMGPVLKASLSP